MNIPVVFDEHIYEASAETLLDRICSVQPGAHVYTRSTLVVYL